MDYIGEKCSACGKEFTADDDIVVCPKCGSPHHRECWLKENKCANESYHASGKKWQRIGIPSSEQETVICPVCRFPNTPEDEKCRRCGTDLKTGKAPEFFGENENSDRGFIDEETITFDFAGFDPEEDFGGVKLRDISSFVATNTIYYIPIFKRMKDFGTKFSFNLACLAFPSLYFANRKMWGWAVFAAVLSIVMSLPLVILYMADMTIPQAMANAINSHSDMLNILDSVFSFADWVIRIVFCLLGNRIYYGFVMRSLRRLKSENHFSREELMAAGGIRPMNMLLMILIKGALAIALGFTVYTIFNMMTVLSDFSTVSLFI